MPEPVSNGGGPVPGKRRTAYLTDLAAAPDAMTKQAQPKAAPLPAPAPGVWEPPDAAELTRVLPGYDVLALIGSGGMGAVYRAKQKSLERLVAVKLLSPELAECAPEFTERFNQEAGVLAKLSHPGIVHLFDCGRTSDGQLFIAMELVQGRDLAERLAGKEPLPVKEVLAMAIEVCGALEHAHQRGVIHRDLKPANVMLDAKGRVKITDFGLARIIQKAVPKERQTTSLPGTPRFTAPEALAPGAEVDERADVFSVGVMLYQMLTGEVPRGPAAAPSTLAPELDARFDAIVTKAMADSPGQRHASVTALRAELEEIRLAATPTVLPAATRIAFKKEDTELQARSVERMAPPSEHAGELYDEEEEPPPEPTQASSRMPWLAILVLAAVAGLWAWQQRKHPNDGVASNPTSVTEAPAPSKLAEPGTSPAAAPAEPPPISAANPAPAAPTTPPAPPQAMPLEPSPAELAELQGRIGQIQGDFTAGVKEWQAGQDVKFSQLDAQYLRAVKAGIIAMRNERRLSDLTGLQEEERLLAAKTPLPPLDLTAPPERVRLRGIYDEQVLQIARVGAEAKIELYNRLLGSLFSYQSILKQTNKLASAAIVAGILEEAVKERDALRASLAPAQ